MSTNRKTAATLWAFQVVLAILFVFAGVMKLVTPAAVLAAQAGPTGLSAGFFKFIGVCELLGGLGLVLPGLTRLKTWLTPLAASGLVIIMIGATIVTMSIGPAGPAVVPAIVGLLASVVAYGRWRVVPLRAKAVRVAATHPAEQIRRAA